MLEVGPSVSIITTHGSMEFWTGGLSTMVATDTTK